METETGLSTTFLSSDTRPMSGREARPWPEESLGRGREAGVGVCTPGFGGSAGIAGDAGPRRLFVHLSAGRQAREAGREISLPPGRVPAVGGP